jgi:DNA polymerase-4
VTLLPAVRPHQEGRLLSDLNLRRITEVAALPLSRLLLAFRQSGYPLYRQARGLDDAPVRPPSRQPAVHVDETLAEDANDDRMLAAILSLLVQRGGARLRAAGVQATGGRLAVRHADGQTMARRLRLAPPTADDAALFRQLPRPLAALPARRTRVRWLGLTLDGLQPAARQLLLFPAGGAPQEPALAAALDRIRRRYGESAVRRLTPVSGPATAGCGAGPSSATTRPARIRAAPRA